MLLQYPPYLRIPPGNRRTPRNDPPLHYQFKGDAYTLYSNGWDQKDNGGIYSNDPAKAGDWPWPSP